MHKHYRKENNCLNCGSVVTDKFCSKCGQENLETKENFFHLSFEFISDYFHFDSKFASSIIPLFTKPGYLTKEYLSGKRVRFIPPLRMFFFTIILFVLVDSMVYKKLEPSLEKGITINDNAKTRVDSIISKEDSIEQVDAKAIINGDNKKINRKTIMQAIEAAFVKEAKYLVFLLLPIYALILKLLYYRRKRFYVDHLIFLMHFLSFCFLMLTIGLSIPLIMNLDINAYRVVFKIWLLITVIYSYVALKRVYDQNYFKTLFKTILFNSIYWLTTIIIFASYAIYSLVT